MAIVKRKLCLFTRLISVRKDRLSSLLGGSRRVGACRWVLCRRAWRGRSRFRISSQGSQCDGSGAAQGFRCCFDERQISGVGGAICFRCWCGPGSGRWHFLTCAFCVGCRSTVVGGVGISHPRAGGGGVQPLDDLGGTLRAVGGVQHQQPVDDLKKISGKIAFSCFNRRDERVVDTLVRRLQAGVRTWWCRSSYALVADRTKSIKVSPAAKLPAEAG